MTKKTVAVEIRDVSKNFILRHDKSVKERLLNFSSSKASTKKFRALKDVTADIYTSSTVGLIGPNGSGKSTLLKVIGGILQPTTGKVRLRGRLAALLELGAGFHPDLTGRDNVYLNSAILGLSKEETDLHFDENVDFSGIRDFIDTQVKFYSSGMYVRLAFSVAVHVDPDILIVDEVLAVGDEPFQRKCLDRIRQFQERGKTIIIVSHSLEQVGELCDRVLVLEHGEVVFDGEPAAGLRILRQDFDEKANAAEPSTPMDHNLNLKKVSIEYAGKTNNRKPISLSPHEPLRVRVAIEARKMTRDCVVGIGLETPLGHPVFGTNTEMLKFEIPPFVGTKVVTFDMDQGALGAGTYLVHASLGTKANGETSRISNAGRINIHSDGRTVGTGFMRTKVKLDSVPISTRKSR